MNRPPVNVNLGPYFKTEARGHNAKTLIVCHETVSHNVKGLGDIRGVADFMDRNGVEVHGIIDMEGNVGWTYDRRAIYDHCASGSCNVNTRSVGFELVSEIPFLDTNAKRKMAWLSDARKRQLNTLARWCAWLSTVEKIPLRYSNGKYSGITTHWSVSQACLGGKGHWDCYPIHKGGHFPVLYVIEEAQRIARAATR